MTKTKAGTHGGRREGAGRPPSIEDGQKREAVLTVLVSPTEKDALRAAAKAEGLSMSALVLRALHESKALGRNSRPTIGRKIRIGV